MNKQPFLPAIPILNHITAHGFEAYFVGGAVRDYIMNRPIHDIDITTSATPDEIEAIFKHTIPIGKEHGTINVVVDGENYEVTTYRTESEYVDHRRPGHVAFVRNLYEDILRRDFTMNAIAMDAAFNIVDHFNGQHDIAQQVIRTVEQPDDRFEEDALRILRGIRFYAQLGFTIEQETRAAMKRHIPEIDYLSIERIVTELKKLICASHAKKGVALLHSLNAWAYIPYFKQFNMSLMIVQSAMPFTLFIAITEKTQPEINASLKLLKLSNKEQQAVTTYRKLIDDLPEIKSEKQLKQYVYDYGVQPICDVLAHSDTLVSNAIEIPTSPILSQAHVTNVAQQLPIRSRQALAINGHEVMDVCQRKPGKWLKETLRALECSVVQGDVSNTQTALIEWVKKNVKND